MTTTAALDVYWWDCLDGNYFWAVEVTSYEEPTIVVGILDEEWQPEALEDNFLPYNWYVIT